MITDSAIARSPFVITGMMRETARIIHSAQMDSGLVVVSGPSRAGKTTTVLGMHRGDLRMVSPGGKPLRSRYFQAAGEGAGGGAARKRGMKILYTGAIGALDEGVWRRFTPQELANYTARAIVQRGIDVVFIDEAGQLALDELDGMVTVWNIVRSLGRDFSLVLVGMDELPALLQRKPQIRYRIQAWCYFQPNSLDDTWAVLAALHPHFGGLSLQNRLDRQQVAFVHETYEGITGRMVPFLRRLTLRMGDSSDENVDLEFLRTVVEDLRLGEQRALQAAQNGYPAVLNPLGDDQ